jgi:hypothetical protein
MLDVEGMTTRAKLRGEVVDEGSVEGVAFRAEVCGALGNVEHAARL